jgi:small subunit ribosomal protein S16
MLTIRLQRGGKRNTAQYKVVLAKKTAANQKQFVEIMGAYNPHTKELTIRSQERLNYWLNEQHVELSETVHNLFVTKELIKDKKVKAFTVPKKEVVSEEKPAEEAKSEESAAEASETPAETEAPATPETPEQLAPEVEEAVEAPAEEAKAE